MTYGDKSDVKLMIGDDGEREKETDGRNKTDQLRFTVVVNQTDRYMLWTECVNNVKGELERAKR